MTATSAASGPPVRSRSVQFAAIAVGIVLLLLVALLITRKNSDDRATESPVVGKQAPALAGKAVIGQPFDIGTNDRWLVVNFFATWCAPCVNEHPELRAFSAEHAKDGKARVVSVVYKQATAEVRKFFEQRGGDWNVVDSANGRTSLDWGVAQIPETFLVAPSGIVVERFTGEITRRQLDDAIDSYETSSSLTTTSGTGTGS
ncbi:MAG: ccmG [Acidimicrobiales bacterium]|nr:ccmG [Acidimicrobiales bacterium]